MKVSIQVTGAKEVQEVLRVTTRRLGQGTRALLQTLGGMMQTFFQEHIRSEEGPDGPWPELAPATRAIRDWYGHPPAGPKLIRTGDLLHSITTLQLGSDFVEVGTKNPAAPVLHTGGEVTDDRGRTRSVQAFPFVWLSPDQVQDLLVSVFSFYFEEG